MHALLGFTTADAAGPDGGRYFTGMLRTSRHRKTDLLGTVLTPILELHEIAERA